MARKMKHVGNRDRNEPEIVAEFECLGFYVIRMPRDAGFDLICIGKGYTYIVEVKNPEVDWKITNEELEFAKKIREYGSESYVVLDKQDVQDLISYGFSRWVYLFNET